MYVITRGFFPIAERDLVLSRFDQVGDEFSYFVGFSIEKDDYPINPKYIRAEIMSKWYFGVVK